MSKAIRTALYTRLTSDATLTALLASAASIYDEQAPQGATKPYIVFSRPSQVVTARGFGGDGVDNDVWQIKAITTGAKADAGDAIAARIAVRLDHHKLVVASHRTLLVQRESGIRYAENKDSTLVWHIGGLYRIQTEPA